MRHVTIAMLLVVLVAVPAAAAKKPPPADTRSEAELIKAMGTGPATLRLRAAKALGRKGKHVVGKLIKALKHKDWKMRRSAADALAELGPDAAGALKGLIEALKDKDPWVRDGAAFALGKMGAAAKPAAKALVETMKGADDWICETVIASIGSVTKDKDILLDAAIVVMGQPSSSYIAKRYAGGLLRKHGKGEKRVIPAIVSQLANVGEGMWRGVDNEMMTLLGTFGPDAAPAVGALTRLLAHRQPDLRTSAAKTLGLIGRPAKPAISALKDLAANDEKEGVRAAAAAALKLIQ